MDDLRTYFAARLPVRLDEIEAAWRESLHSSWETEPLRRFHRLVHSLAGAGTTFGYPEVSRAARDLERFVEPVSQAGGAPGDPAGFAARVEELLAGLREASERPAPEPIPEDEAAGLDPG
jgi:HPt (histidine-containing phosphotransfer) domain-containing protein